MNQENNTQFISSAIAVGIGGPAALFGIGGPHWLIPIGIVMVGVGCLLGPLGPWYWTKVKRAK